MNFTGRKIPDDRDEKFNLGLFRKLGDLGLLGISVDSAYGGSEMDALAAVIVGHAALVDAFNPGWQDPHLYDEIR